MSVNSAGPASFFSQPAFAAPASRKAAEPQPPEKGPSAEAAKEQDEARANRVMSPEEEEERRKTLAGIATREFREILEADAHRREGQGLSPTGVAVNITV